jgi:hypothetical protein
VSYGLSVLTGATAPTDVTVAVIKNGSTSTLFGVSSANDLTGGTKYRQFSKSTIITGLSAGDTLEVVASCAGQNVTVDFGNSGAEFSNFVAQRISGPSVVQATETVAMRAGGFANGTLGTSAVTQIFTSVDNDSHSAYNSITGIYTIPVSGRYDIWCQMELSGTLSANVSALVNIVKNGSTTLAIGFSEVNGGGALNFMDVRVREMRRFNAGDTIQITANASNAGTTRTTNTQQNIFIIERVGN